MSNSHLVNFSSYAVASTALTFGVIYNAYYLREQFYSTVVHLVKSKFSLVVLLNFTLMLVMFLAKVIKRIFFNALRASEVEMLWENTGYAITETCLALTIFRDELDLNTGLLFGLLLFTKAFHWLAKARGEHLEQNEETFAMWSTHVRMLSFLGLLIISDAAFAVLSMQMVIDYGVSVQLLFGFEFLLLSLSAFTTLSKYILAMIDVHIITGRWDNKSLYDLYLKLVISLLHLMIYSLFFTIVFMFYGIPIHLLRNLYLSFHNVQTRIKHFLQFRRVTASLNTRFADATFEELEQTDKICIICREEMELPNPNENTENANVEINPESRIKKLECGHIFHFYCLRTWFERQLKCPTCRADILPRANQNVAANIRNNNANPIQPPDNFDRARAADNIRRGVDRINQLRRRLPALNPTSNNVAAPVARNNTEEVPPPPPPLPPPRTSAASNSRQGRHRVGTRTINTQIRLQHATNDHHYFSVNEYLQSQIDLLSLQLQMYSAQVNAANATREAAMAVINLSNRTNAQSTPPTEIGTDNNEDENNTNDLNVDANNEDDLIQAVREDESEDDLIQAEREEESEDDLIQPGREEENEVRLDDLDLF